MIPSAEASYSDVLAGARTSFSLLTEPWVLVRGVDGSTREISLLDVFDQAHELAAIVGEIPTQDAAVLRLCLAILYRATTVEDDAPISTWEALWTRRRLMVAEVRDYLDEYKDRFDLLHPVAPFFQVADLHTASGSTSGLAKLIAEVPDGEPFFTTRANQAVARLSYAEAARWLVHCQAYDYSGIKSGAVGDARVKDGKGYPIGIGFTGTLGLLLAEGPTLAETLLLNLVLRRWTPRDRVPWEYAPHGPAADPTHTQPTGPADVATWQARRIRLIHDGIQVVDAIVANGDPLGQQNRQHLEPLSSWRYSEPQTKKLKTTTYMPLEHDPDRALWRGLPALLGERVTEQATKAGVAAYERATLLDWLTDLRDDEALSATDRVTLRAIGVKYGPQNSSVGTVIDERLALPLGVLVDPVLRQCATEAADVAEQAVRALGLLATNLADAAGRHLLPGADDGERIAATAQTFAQLDHPYRRWVAGLVDPDQTPDRRVKWQRQVRGVVLAAGSDLVVDAGKPALVGRVVHGSFLNAAKAEVYFRAAVHKALPALDQPRTLEDS